VQHWTRIASLKTADAFRAHLERLGVELPFDDQVAHDAAAPLAQPIEADGLRAGNRFAILPMEGWDGTPDGRAGEFTRRRWRHFGESGAKLIWGGEAVAVRFDGRANPNQLVIAEHTLKDLAALREGLLDAHRERFGGADDPVVGLQLTHSGRYARPSASGPAPRIVYRHPLLDRRVGVDSDEAILSDGEIDRLIGDFVVAAKRAEALGFHFVDIKHCHGYFGHELLSARSRGGSYGGSLANRLRFLREVAAGIHAEAPRLRVAVRLSIFDAGAFAPGPDGVGVPVAANGAPAPFGASPPTGPASIDDADELLARLEEMGVRWICSTAGSPYYNPHVQRPALFPPSDGYLPPEDPLAGVARHIDATARLKARHPALTFVGSAYSYLQEWLPHVAQAAVRTGQVDVVGIGRLVLSYPGFPADVLSGRPLQARALCRTFSDCTTAPRNGLISGCYPLDKLYAQMPEARRLKALKASAS
jgi:2,4-dienoyl-CoA reductase-like NADH-dependent reductase (Old Yellow Enzyme family)